MPRTGRDAPRTNWFAELTYSELLRNRLTVVEALKRYLAEVTLTRRPSTAKVERLRFKIVI